MLLKALFVGLLAVGTFAAIGGDVSEYYGEGTLKCCRDKGWEFIVIRSYHSFGGVDTNAPRTLRAAQQAGIKTRDVYHFPCHGKVSAQTQVADDYNHVKGMFDTMWFDIETNPSPGCEWSHDKNSNCKFMGELIAAGKSHNIQMGIYASEYMWSGIMGDCKVGADHDIPLWYAHYDGSESFRDFSPFGGWSKPAAKQFADSVGYCDISADADWKP